MIYVKLNSDGDIEKYPYNLYDLNIDFPHTSFTIPVEESSLNNRNIYKVTQSVKPEADHTKNVVEGTPILQNNEWVQVWVIENATQEQIQQKFDVAAYDIRKQRSDLLSSCDWTQVADSPADKQAWATYRQALRDISVQPNFPWSVEWPVAPS